MKICFLESVCATVRLYGFCVGFLRDLYSLCTGGQKDNQAFCWKTGFTFLGLQQARSQVVRLRSFFKFLGVVEGRISTAFPSLSFGLHPGRNITTGQHRAWQQVCPVRRPHSARRDALQRRASGIPFVLRSREPGPCRSSLGFRTQFSSQPSHD